MILLTKYTTKTCFYRVFFFCTSSCTMKTWFSYVFGKQNHVFMKGFFWNNNFFKSIWGVNSISRLGISICFSLGPSIWKCVGSFYFHMLFAIFTSLFKKIWNLSFAHSLNPYNPFPFPNNAHRTTDFQFCAWHGLIEAHGECDGVVIMMLESLAYIDYLGFSFMYSVVQCKSFGLPSSHFFFGL